MILIPGVQGRNKATLKFLFLTQSKVWSSQVRRRTKLGGKEEEEEEEGSVGVWTQPNSYLLRKASYFSIIPKLLQPGCLVKKLCLNIILWSQSAWDVETWGLEGCVGALFAV